MAFFPVEIVELIYDRLKTSDLVALSSTCRLLRSIALRRLWANLEITLYGKSLPGGIGSSNWTEFPQASFWNYNSSSRYSTWIVIGAEEFELFWDSLHSGKLLEQLKWVETLNFDQQLLYPNEPTEKYQIHKAQRRYKKWLKAAWSGHYGKGNGKGSFDRLRVFLRKERMPRLKHIRLRGDTSTASLWSDHVATEDLLTRFPGVETSVWTTGKFPMVALQSSVVPDYVKYLTSLSLMLSSTSELPRNLPRSLKAIELWSYKAITVAAEMIGEVLHGLPRLVVVTTINLTVYNTEKTRWLPSCVRVLNISIGKGNYLEGRIGDPILHPGLEVLIIQEGYGSVRSILPTNLRYLDLGFHESPSPSYEEQLFKENPELKHLTYHTPTREGLIALGTHCRKVKEMELWIDGGRGVAPFIASSFETDFRLLRRLKVVFENTSLSAIETIVTNSRHLRSLATLIVIIWEPFLCGRFVKRNSNCIERVEFSSTSTFSELHMNISKLRKVVIS
ncbi:hypothetical protein TRVA0_006S02586 [Trichomonascus vanleenenianus]|uniref:F-box protein n=1 Tax=Trichomonascus vanleenenianus TaxID=2268995 RepID=UPI003ECB2C21